MNITIRLKGGSGSGNFGHAGRPGLVGGSASRGGGSVPKDDGTKVRSVYDNIDHELNAPDVLRHLKIPKELYHVTSADNVDSVLKKGLVPGSARKSTSGDIRGVYLTDDPYDVIDKQGDILIENPVILKISTDGLNLRLDPEYYYYGNTVKSSLLEYIDDVNDGIEGYAMYSKVTIPGSNVIGVTKVKR